MKICLIASAFRPYSTGGADVAVENTVDGLVKQGHEVIVITAGFLKGFKSLWLRPEILPTVVGKLTVYRYYPLNLFSFLNINYRPSILRLPWHVIDMFNFHAYFVTNKILHIEKPQIVLTHNLKGVSYLAIRVAEKYAKKFKVRHIHTVHDVQLSIPTGRIIKGEEESWQNKGPFTRLYEFLNRLIFSSPQVVVSASQFLLDFYVERKFFCNSKKIVLLNPLKPQVPAVFKPSQQLNFLYLGQLENHKGIVFLVETFKIFLNKYPKSARLLIVGGGALLNQVKRISVGYEEIVVRGVVAHRDLPEVFTNIDATIFPSLCYENSPTIIGESLSFGVPVIAAQIGGVQLVQHSVNGYIFQAGSSDDLLKTLEHCLYHKDDLVALRKNTVLSVQGLDINSYLEKLLNL